MAYRATGTIIELGTPQRVTERFTKREFVLDIPEHNPEYSQPVQFELTQDRVGKLDGYQIGDVVDVEFQLRGKRWVGRDGRVQHALRVGCATGFDAAAGGE